MNAPNNMRRLAQKLNPFATMRGLVSRATEFMQGDVHEFYEKVICSMEPAHATGMLLTGIFLSLWRIAESTDAGANSFDVTAWSLRGTTAAATKVLEPRTDGRRRHVYVWVDDPTGLPVGTELRWSVNGAAVGPLLQLGVVNELGFLPANSALHLSSTASMRVFVVEES